MSELKSCPFCGRSACITKVSESHGMDGHYYDWLVRCKCGVSLRRAADNFYGRKAYTKEEAIAAWNRRADGWIKINNDDESTKPKDFSAVNVVWVNRDPSPYYAHEKDISHVGTAHYMDKERGWYWESPVCYDMLAEYGDSITDQVAYGIEITHWQPLPELPRKEE